jgi:predicted CopG family antitoxin
MSHQITITVSDETYQGLQAVAGPRTISEVIEDLARPAVADLESAYAEMSLDSDREREATDWIEGLVQL